MADEPGTIRVLVVDRQQLFRQGISELLGTEPDIEVVGHCAPGAAAVALTERFEPSVVLFQGDGAMTEAAEGVRALLQRRPGTRIVVMLSDDRPRLIAALIASGAHAYVLRSATKEELLVTIRAVHRNAAHVVVQVSRATLRELNGANRRVLSRREREVITLVAAGKRNGEIARELFISEGTVKRHLTNLYGKLGVTSRMAAVKQAVALGIVDFADPGESG